MEPLKPIEVVGDDFDRYAEDVDRMVKIMEERGFLCARDQARRIWEKVSESVCAGWLFLPNDDDAVFRVMQHHFRATRTK